MEKERLPDRAKEMGETILRFFGGLRRKYPIIADVRGLGAMCAIEMVDPESGEPARDVAVDVIQRAWRKGVMLLRAGVHGNIIRFLAPLVMTPEQLREGLDIIAEAVAEAAEAR